MSERTALEKRCDEQAQIVGDYADAQIKLDADIAIANRKIDALVKACKCLLSFVPAWAQQVEPGLCATMYGTGSESGDRIVVAQVEDCRQALAEAEPESTP